MSITAAQLRIELGKRMGETFISTPTSAGTTTTLIDTSLNQYLPATVGAANELFVPWVLGSSTADASNVGVMRRAQVWNASTSTLTFFSGAAAWPAAVTTGSYEVHLRTDPTRKLEAINEAVGQLGLWWYREFVDTSITTAEQTWAYTLPAAQYIARLWQVEYQVDTDVTDIGFPYADAVSLNWDLRETTDTTGAFTQTLQFGILPPWPRTLRLRGEAYFPDLVNDSDILPLSGKWQRPALAWIYQYAAHILNNWQGDAQPKGDIDRYTARTTQLLQQAENLKKEMSRPHKPGRIVVPNKGQGLLASGGLSNSPSWLAALHNGN